MLFQMMKRYMENGQEKHQPDPEKKPDLLQGLITIRQMFLKIMEDTKLPIADEMLYPENA